MITDSNDIFLYFEWIKQTKPAQVLDVGMFLQGIGAVSRQAMNCEIPENIILHGVSLSEKILPVYTQIYDQMVDIKSICQFDAYSYDLIYYLNVQGLSSDIEMEALWRWLLAHGITIVADTKNVALVNFMAANAVCQTITIENKQYILIHGKAIPKNRFAKTVSCDLEKDSLSRDIRIYVAAHRIFSLPEGMMLDEDMYIPLQVGREGRQALPYVGDNTGDNISQKNDTYCELTGMYWIWKNVNCDIVGLCHYRRYFTEDGRILAKKDICNLMKQYDVVVGNSSMSPYGSVAAHYANKHHWQDMLACRAVIKEDYPEYLEAFDRCMDCNLMNIANMMIAPKSVFDNYCCWLFEILAAVEKRTDVSGYDAYQKRLYGFLSERLLRVWLLKQQLKIKEVMISLVSD